MLYTNTLMGTTGVTASDVGLGNVDNTADATKPVSAPQQLALDAKVAIADIINTLTSTAANKPLSANMGKVLKGHIDNINTLLQSDTGTLDTLQEVVDYVKLNRADLNNLGISGIAGLQAALDNKLSITDPKLTDAREWSASTVSKVEAEAGVAEIRRAWTALRVREAILQTLSDKNIEDGATANATDGDLRDRSTHTGTQPVSSITGLGSAATESIAAIRSGTTKSHVGLGNVDNTSDADKPVSTAQQSALNDKVNIADVINSLTSTSTNKPLSANMGKALKGHIDNINALLQSDTGTLDTLQEVVDYIKLNRSDLDALGISSIAGLQAALNSKAASSHNHSASDLTSGTVSLDRLPASVKIGDTTYTAGSGLSLTGTEFSVDSPFNPTGNYSGLRAQATTKADVGLSSVDNYSRAHYDGRYLAAGAKAADSDMLDGQHASAFAAASHSHSWTQVTGKPSTYPPEAHTHPYLPVAGKAADSDKLDGQAGSYYRNASYLNAGTVPLARLPASVKIGDTTYTAGSGLSLVGTEFSVDNPFNPSGNYASLRARGTTKADVGLGSVENYNRAHYDARYLAAGAKAADSDKLDGFDSTQFVRSDTGKISAARLPNATATAVGGVKVRLNGTTGYITSNGSNA